MKKRNGSRIEPEAVPQVEQDDSSVLDKIQQQLVNLEKKIDALIGTCSSRPAEVKQYQKPFQQNNYGRSNNQVRQDNPFRDRVLHKAVCADCGEACEVPFRPSGDRPVFCKQCFGKRKVGDSFKARPDHKPREESYAPKKHFVKKARGGEHRPFTGKKKTGFRKRK